MDGGWLPHGVRLRAHRKTDGNAVPDSERLYGEDFEAYLKREMMNEAQRRDLERRVTEILRLVEG